METNKTLYRADAQSVNFREIAVGQIAPKTLYRSSHPIQDNKQEPVIALLAAEARITAVINLTDTGSGLRGKALFAPWYNRLYKSGRIIALGMDFDFSGKGFNQKLKKALQFIINTEGPWLIHCHAGVDRTGFVSMVLEALMGAALEEIAEDYLQSFNSIFGSSIYNYSNTADSLAVMRLLSVMNGLPVNDHNVQDAAERYLSDTIKLSLAEISALKIKLAAQDYPAGRKTAKLETDFI